MKYIEFINHASVYFTDGSFGLLTDPWYSGNSFDDGWSLIYENNHEDITNLLDKTDYIWISHEHPDHFSVGFYKKYLNKIKENKIKIIFQKTKDRRVIDFFSKQKIETIELSDFEVFKISENFSLKIQKFDFYDSALFLEINNIKIFNLNDCPITNENEIKKIRNRYGSCDILLTQFSYAAWKGGAQNLEWRKKAAYEKRQTLIKQSNLLGAKILIPFASFIFFNNMYNFYLNDSSNRPEDIIKLKDEIISDIVFLRPNEKQIIDNIKQDTASLIFWNEKYKNIFNKKLQQTKKYEKNEIEIYFQEYCKRIFSKNSKFLMKIISKIKFLSIFQTLNIHLKDHNENVKVDLINQKLTFANNLKPDIELNSSSLIYIFRFDFGFDTLTVNGCFEEKSFKGFAKMSKLFAIGNLNNMGHMINYRLILNLKLIFLFLKKLATVQLKLKKRNLSEN